MTARDDAAQYWDDLLVRWVGGDREVPPDLPPWLTSYSGAGRGAVTLDAFPEPYLGPLAGADPALVLLGLNPGRAAMDFQGPAGVFTRQIAESSYSQWAAGAPYSSSAWESVKGRNRYHRSRLRFARALLARDDVQSEDLLTVELYPWHSTAVTATMRPPPDLLDRFVWSPLRELDVEFVFAFGKPWVNVADSLGIGEERPLRVPWSAPGRRAVTYVLPSQQTLVAVHQPGYAGPPSPTETRLLKAALGAGP